LASFFSIIFVVAVSSSVLTPEKSLFSVIKYRCDVKNLIPLRIKIYGLSFPKNPNGQHKKPVTVAIATPTNNNSHTSNLQTKIIVNKRITPGIIMNKSIIFNFP
jgi:hypothetical protein